MCPLRLSFYAKGGTTSVVFARPTVIAQGSPALPVVVEIEQLVIEAIKAGVAKAGAAQ